MKGMMLSEELADKLKGKDRKEAFLRIAPFPTLPWNQPLISLNARA